MRGRESIWMAGPVRRLCAWWLCAICAGGCGLAPLPRTGELSLGRASHGVLLRGTALPARGEGFVRALPEDPTRFGTRALVEALQRAAASVQQAYPGAALSRVGDLSLPQGGKHPKHGSHRTGRDADVLYYLLDAQGVSARGRGWLSFGAEGYSVESRAPGAPGNGEAFFFDTERNWHWIRTLLLDPDVQVEWIFCGAEVKARLLRWAALHEMDPRVIVHAASIVHQPSFGNPHTDHFHVRLACTSDQRGQGCRDVGPAWPWSRLQHEKPPFAPARYDDATLVRELLGAPPAARGRDGPSQRSSSR